jgi:hypothetical protein
MNGKLAACPTLNRQASRLPYVWSVLRGVRCQRARFRFLAFRI